MAEYKIDVDHSTGNTLVEITGLVDVEGTLQFVNSEEYSERTSRIIFDVRQASVGDMPRGVLAKMVRSMRDKSRPGARAAFLLNKGRDLRKAKLFLAQLEAEGFAGSFRIFTDSDKATTWMQE